MRNVMVVFGTRPEAIKLAPIIHALRGRSDCRTLVCSTGQHRELLAGALAVFDIQPDIDLDLMTPGQTPTDVLGRVVSRFGALLREHRPDTLVVQGDTTTVMGAALAAFYGDVEVAHVEAGLRTNDRRAPFPEEVNRRVTGVVADLHFAPTAVARGNLVREGVAPDRIFVTGNTVVDALKLAQRRLCDTALPPELDVTPCRLVLVTAHRRESFGEPLRNICMAIRDLVRDFPDIEVIYPVHLNPNVREPAHEILGNQERIRLTAPLDYADMVRLLSRATLVLSDSGGVQEEAPSLGAPLLILRDKTERPEVVSAGAALLVGTNRDMIFETAGKLLSNDAARAEMARPRDIFGDGLAAQRIVEGIVDREMRTPPFEPVE
ncbi:MAG: UDP-N-acetylglucosamine 2-epimerase (non-hydrolyzing) [Phycisphaerales bacterium]|nr:UDP-N-acetylglucosamine 2-epimerase (non-hydrolyzing) [Phycisphaerales bacterium]